MKASQKYGDRQDHWSICRADNTSVAIGLLCIIFLSLNINLFSRAKKNDVVYWREIGSINQDIVADHFSLLIMLAEKPAPKPLSIFTTVTPDEQLVSIASRADMPPKLAP